MSTAGLPELPIDSPVPSLRDQIAIAVLNGLLSSANFTADYCVDRAYTIADEAMARRLK